MVRRVMAQPWYATTMMKTMAKKQRTNRCPHRRKEGTEITLGGPAKEAPA
jgi:hypothetical protein